MCRACLVPPHTYHTVTDAWNGYHLVPLREEDHHLTTFITEYGRYTYNMAPQSYLSAGDGYNMRYDDLIANVERKMKCVDDMCMWNELLEGHWWRVMQYLDKKQVLHMGL